MEKIIKEVTIMGTPKLPTGMKGFDTFFADPAAVSLMKCKVCGTFCNVKRGVSGPTSWAGAMSGNNCLHDYFSCPHRGEDWHKQALQLVLEIDKCSSPTLVRIMTGDLEAAIEVGKNECNNE